MATKESDSGAGASSEAADEEQAAADGVGAVSLVESVDDSGFASGIASLALGQATTSDETDALMSTPSTPRRSKSAATTGPTPAAEQSSKPSKKRFRFLRFLSRAKHRSGLSRCVEADTEDNDIVSDDLGSFALSHDSPEHVDVPQRDHLYHRAQSPDPEYPPGEHEVRRLSMGARGIPFGFLQHPSRHLMTLVPPAPLPFTLGDLDTHPRVLSSVHLHHDLGFGFNVGLSACQIGYPHLRFNRSMSSSSSSGSSGVSVMPVQPPPVPTPDYPPHGSAPTVHTQIDYMHCLVPDLLALTHSTFYWGVMDRYEAERLLDGRPEGTFLVRDSAQEEFLFSVSFRRYGRSLHARIEQWNHKFSFDSHDLGVFAASSVCALVEHYKDPSACMFFEPMLTLPLPRKYVFTLQHLCRAVISSCVRYDDIATLHLPRPLQDYLKYYHYKQRICVRRFESH